MNESAQSIPSTANSKPGSPAAAAEVNSPEAPFPRSLRNVLLMSSSSIVTRVLNLTRGIILARLLTPFDFGVYGLAGSIVGIKERIADIGAGSFLVYRPSELEQHAETTFWINLTLSSFLMVLLAVAAPFLSRIYHEPLLMPVLILLGLGVWARINGSIHQSRLRVSSRFRALAIIDNCSSATWLAIAVVLAWKGFGVWALVASAVSAGAVWTALLFVADGWRPRFRISGHSLRLLGGFSFWFLGQGIFWYAAANLDNWLIGRYLGMGLLGIYAIAYNYALLPITLVGNAMGNVGFAELPKLYGHPDRFWSSYREFSRVLALLGCFLSFAAIVAAPDLIPLVLGAKWEPSVVPFQILSLYAAAKCLWMDPFLSLGNFRLSCLTGVFAVIIVGGAIAFGLRFGLVGVAFAMLSTQVAYQVASLFLVSRSWRLVANMLRLSIPYLFGGALAASFGLGIWHFAPAGTPVTRLPIDLLALAAFAATYALLFRRDLGTTLRQLLDRRTA
jgi:O-antigen/teichoic acid export membrane protein